MKQRIWIAFGLIALALLGGCAGGGHGRNINDASNSLVFGYVDMSDAPTKINGASIMQVAPPTDKPYWGTDVRNVFDTQVAAMVCGFGDSISF